MLWDPYQIGQKIEIKKNIYITGNTLVYYPCRYEIHKALFQATKYIKFANEHVYELYVNRLSVQIFGTIYTIS